MTVCFICERNIALSQLQHHFNIYHHYGNNLPFKCAESRCSVNFENFTSFYQPIQTQHNSMKSQALKSNSDPELKISSVNVQHHVRSKLIEIFTNLYETNVSHLHIQHTMNIIQDLVSSG